MKKFLALIVALVLVLSVCACSGNKEDGKDTSATTTNSDVTTVSDETTAGGDETTAKTYTTEEILAIVGTALNSYEQAESTPETLMANVLELTTNAKSKSVVTYNDGKDAEEETTDNTVVIKFDGKGSFTISSYSGLEIAYVGGVVYAKCGDKAIKGALTDPEQIADILETNGEEASSLLGEFGLEDQSVPTDLSKLTTVFNEVKTEAGDGVVSVYAKGINQTALTALIAAEAAKDEEFDADELSQTIAMLTQMIKLDTIEITITASTDGKLASIKLHIDMDMTSLAGLFDQTIVSNTVATDVEETIKYVVDEIKAPEGEYEEVEISSDMVNNLSYNFEEFEDFE